MMAHDNPRMAQYGHRLLQDGPITKGLPKMAQDDPGTALEWHRINLGLLRIALGWA
jgi:hypothetical protein